MTKEEAFDGRINGLLDGEPVNGRFTGSITPNPETEVIFEYDHAFEPVRPKMFERKEFVGKARNSRLYSKVNSWRFGLRTNVGRLLFPIKYMLPGDIFLTKLAADRISTWVQHDDPDSHCQVRVASEHLTQKTWLKPCVDYIWDVSLEMRPEHRWGEIPWVLPLQGHSGSHGPFWLDPTSRPPMLGLYLKRDHWEFYVNGSTQPKPMMADITSLGRQKQIPFHAGIQEIKIKFRIDPLGDTSYGELTLNGTTHPRIQRPLGINVSSLGVGKPSLNLTMGYYGPKPYPNNEIQRNQPSNEIKPKVVTILDSKLSVVKEQSKQPFTGMIA